MTEIPPLSTDASTAVRRLTRAREGRWFGGVCAGLGRYFDISPAVYRLAFAALALAGGTGILLYLAAWLVIPDEGSDASLAEQALRRHRDRPVLAVGVGLLGLAAIVLLSHAVFWPHSGNIWLAALLVGGGLVWWELHGRRAAPAPETPADAVAAPPAPRRPSFFGPVIGVLVLAAGVLGLLAAADVDAFDLRFALAGAVILVGAAIAAGAATGRTISGLIGLGILLLAALAVALTVRVPLRGGVGDRVERVASALQLRTEYHQSIGDLNLDLHDVSLPTGRTRVRVTLGIGDLHVRVPSNVNVDATGEAHAGEVNLLGRDEHGVNVRETVRDKVPDAASTIVIDAEVGVGDIRVERG